MTKQRYDAVAVGRCYAKGDKHIHVGGKIFQRVVGALIKGAARNDLHERCKGKHGIVGAHMAKGHCVHEHNQRYGQAEANRKRNFSLRAMAALTAPFSAVLNCLVTGVLHNLKNRLPGEYCLVKFDKALFKRKVDGDFFYAR